MTIQSQDIEGIRYCITDLTLKSIIQIEKLVTKIESNSYPQLIKNSSSILQVQILEEIHSLTVFFNLNKNIHTIKRILKGQEVPQDKTGQIILNIKNAYEYMCKNTNKNEDLGLYELVHIVKILQHNIIEDWQQGVIRDLNQSIVSDFLEHMDITKEARPYTSNLTTHALANLIKMINENNTIHPLIKATILLKFIKDKTPFLALNYLSSFILFRWVLIKFGYETVLHIPILKILDYLNNADLANSSKINPTNGIDENLSILIEKIAMSMAKVINLSTEKFIQNFDIKKDFSLNERQKLFLNYLSKSNNTKITRDTYTKMFNISSMTAYRDLQDLTKKGIINRYGEKKSTYYKLCMQEYLNQS